MKNLLNLLILTGLLVAGAAAQSRVIVRTKTDNVKKANTSKVNDITEPREVIFGFKGVESTPGTCYKLFERCTNNSYVMSAVSEEYSAVMTVSMEYYSDPTSHEQTVVSGGNWSLVVNKDGDYFGTIFGIVQGGYMQPSFDPEGAPCRWTMAMLKITNGLDGYADISNSNAEELKLSATTQLSGGSPVTNAEFTIGL